MTSDLFKETYQHLEQQGFCINEQTLSIFEDTNDLCSWIAEVIEQKDDAKTQILRIEAYRESEGTKITWFALSQHEVFEVFLYLLKRYQHVEVESELVLCMYCGQKVHKQMHSFKGCKALSRHIVQDLRVDDALRAVEVLLKKES